MIEKDYDYFIIYTADAHLSEYISECDKYREYFSGFTGSAGTLLVTLTELYIWVDGRYYIQAEKELKDLEINILHIGENNSLSLTQIINKLYMDGEIVAVDGHCISYSDLMSLMNKLKNCVFDTNAFVPDYIWPDKPVREFKQIRLLQDIESGETANNKIDNIRKKINESFSCDDYCFVISNLTSIMWITNMRGSDIKYVPVCYSYLLIFKDRTLLFINTKSLNNKDRETLLSEGIKCLEYEDFYDYLFDLNVSTVLFDECNCNSVIGNVFKDKRTIRIQEHVFVRKDIKNKTEIDNIRKYHIEDAVAVIRFIKKLKDLSIAGCLPDEYEAACMLDEIRLSNDNCKGLSFETISAYGANGSIVHYSAKKNNCSKLEPRGLYLIDSGAHYSLCTTDITRTISLGGLTEKERKYYTAVLKGNIALSNATFIEGCRGENLDILARESLWNLGLDYRHGTGHGIGCELSVHEGPLSIRYRINPSFEQPILSSGMIVSDEPGVYITDEFGIRIENELLIINKKDTEWGNFLGFEVLTLVPFERDAIVIDMLDEKEKQIINSYHQRIYELLKDYLTVDEVIWLEKETLPL